MRDNDNVTYLMTTYHVAFGGGATIGDRVWAIPWNYRFKDNDTGGAVSVGTVSRGMIGRVTYSAQTYFVDCALVQLSCNDNFPDWLRRAIANHSIQHVAEARLGLNVTKYGQATGRTRGKIIHQNYQDNPLIDDRSWIAPGQLLVDSEDPEFNFLAPGDSGAALLTETNEIVGLLWGVTTSGQGLACPIEPVLDSLQVSLIAPDWALRSASHVAD